MSIRASIEHSQNLALKLYSDLSQRFIDNGLVRETWAALALDMQQQINSIRAFDSSYWNQLRVQQAGDPEGSDRALREFKLPEILGGMSFHDCLSLSLDLEESMILNLYLRVIRLLRSKHTDISLDFYIMVKAHVARLIRIIQSFSGDPFLARRSATLLETFENRVQAPFQVAKPAATTRHESSTKAGHAGKARITAHSGGKTARLKSNASNKHSRSAPKRMKSLVKKIKIARRRAQR